MRLGAAHGRGPTRRLPAGLIKNPLANFNDAAIHLGHRYEVIGRHKPLLRVFPANECFRPNDSVGFQVDLWLVDQVELLVVERDGEILFQLFAFTNFLVNAGNVELEIIVSAFLGQGHGLFGVLQ